MRLENTNRVHIRTGSAVSGLTTIKEEEEEENLRGGNIANTSCCIIKMLLAMSKKTDATLTTSYQTVLSCFTQTMLNRTNISVPLKLHEIPV